VGRSATPLANYYHGISAFINIDQNGPRRVFASEPMEIIAIVIACSGRGWAHSSLDLPRCGSASPALMCSCRGRNSRAFSAAFAKLAVRRFSASVSCAAVRYIRQQHAKRGSRRQASN
jgi:hypothetical protein